MSDSVHYCEGIQMIIDEHPALREQMNGIAKRVSEIEQQAEEAQRAALEELDKRVQSFKVEVRAHSEAEEKEFSPLLGKHLGMDALPVVANEQQHTEAKKLIGEYGQHFASWKEGKEGSLSGMKEALLGAVKVLNEHFDKEENILFPLAERTLTDADKLELKMRLQARKNG